MAGALLTEDSAAGLPEGMSRLSEKFAPIFDILGQLNSEYRAGRTPAPGEGLHLFLLGVSPRYVRQGIAQSLVETCLSGAKRRGYRLAIAEATNKTSQHIFRKMGFIERVRRSYRDHRFHGRAYFTTIVEQGGPMLMEKQLEP
jgi:ribosomal protein S18 acetylase RimI-like enzyme